MFSFLSPNQSVELTVPSAGAVAHLYHSPEG